jgi:hypothetical protein
MASCLGLNVRIVGFGDADGKFLGPFLRGRFIRRVVVDDLLGHLFIGGFGLLDQVGDIGQIPLPAIVKQRLGDLVSLFQVLQLAISSLGLFICFKGRAYIRNLFSSSAITFTIEL